MASAPAPQTSSTARRSPRRAYNRAIGLLHAGEFELGQAIQISETGLLFMTSFRMKTEENCVVTLMIPGGAPLVLRGTVAGERDKVGRLFSYAIEFRVLDLHQRRIIRSYVSAKTQAEAELEDA